MSLLNDVDKEMDRLRKRIALYEKRKNDDRLKGWTYYQRKKRAAIKRTSMDLSRLLVELRRSDANF